VSIDYDGDSVSVSNISTAHSAGGAGTSISGVSGVCDGIASLSLAGVAAGGGHNR